MSQVSGYNPRQIQKILAALVTGIEPTARYTSLDQKDSLITWKLQLRHPQTERFAGLTVQQITKTNEQHPDFGKVRFFIARNYENCFIDLAEIPQPDHTLDDLEYKKQLAQNIIAYYLENAGIVNIKSLDEAEEVLLAIINQHGLMLLTELPLHEERIALTRSFVLDNEGLFKPCRITSYMNMTVRDGRCNIYPTMFRYIDFPLHCAVAYKHREQALKEYRLLLECYPRFQHEFTDLDGDSYLNDEHPNDPERVEIIKQFARLLTGYMQKGEAISVRNTIGSITTSAYKIELQSQIGFPDNWSFSKSGKLFLSYSLWLDDHVIDLRDWLKGQSMLDVDLMTPRCQLFYQVALRTLAQSFEPGSPLISCMIEATHGQISLSYAIPGGVVIRYGENPQMLHRLYQQVGSYAGYWSHESWVSRLHPQYTLTPLSTEYQDLTQNSATGFVHVMLPLRYCIPTNPDFKRCQNLIRQPEYDPNTELLFNEIKRDIDHFYPNASQPSYSLVRCAKDATPLIKSVTPLGLSLS